MRDDSPARSGDWRKSYAHVLQLPPLGCAWEFLRRNPKLTEAWPSLKSVWQETVGEHNLKIVRGGPETLLSPCLWASSLDADAATASYIWNSNATNHVLKVIALPPSAAFGGQILDFEFITGENIVFIAPDGSQQLLFRDGGKSLQLDVRGSPVTEPVAFLVDTALPEEPSQSQLNLLKSFHALRTHGALPDDSASPHPYAKRAALVLMALDGYLAGVPHREIAIAMFGEERVARDWSNPGEHLRDAVRRAVARGVALMEGGYRMFLH